MNSYAGSGCYCNAGYYAPIQIFISNPASCRTDFGGRTYSWYGGTKQADDQQYSVSLGFGVSRYFRQLNNQWVGTTLPTGSNVVLSAKLNTKYDPFRAMTIEYVEYCSGAWRNAAFSLRTQHTAVCSQCPANSNTLEVGARIATCLNRYI